MPLFPGSPVWAPWTPTFTNLTVGNGVLFGRYRKDGKTVHFRWWLKFGSTTSIAGGVLVSLPIPSVSYVESGVTVAPIGHGTMVDRGTDYFPMRLVWSSTTVIVPMAIVTSGTYETISQMSATIPFTWTTTDEITGAGTYEAA